MLLVKQKKNKKQIIIIMTGPQNITPNDTIFFHAKVRGFTGRETEATDVLLLQCFYQTLI